MVWIFLIGQLVATIIWAIKLEGRVTATELATAQQEKRIEAIDAHGTRGFSLLEERQNALARRADGIDERIARIVDFVIGRNPQPPK